ncbi:hypothetical protein [Aquimarina brevivitae]|uniref:Uncharacterized protein n=1 Tax=Aquimarina brevivitae TaxID=323412 RepID=A0A4Q7PFP5_9FLAO|nr:hypothetical protein [Aquimarina brevivitae]RZS99007.1 hypothetical protein EV197_0209 [Aquimarina brevivitae]
MKYFIYALLLIAISLIVYNATLIDFGAPFIGDSKTAVIGVLASLCVVILLIILLISKAIALKDKQRKKNS